MYAADGVTVITERSNATKRIKVKTIGTGTDIEGLAAEIVDKCKLIHHSKIPKVQGLLRELRDREAGGGAGVQAPKPRVGGGSDGVRGTSSADATSSSAPVGDQPVLTKGVVRAVRGRKSFYDERPSNTVVRAATGASTSPPQPPRVQSPAKPTKTAKPAETLRRRPDWAGGGSTLPTHPGNDPTSPTLRQMETLAIAEDERVLRETSAGGEFILYITRAIRLTTCFINRREHGPRVRKRQNSVAGKRQVARGRPGRLPRAALRRRHEHSCERHRAHSGAREARGEPAGVARARHAGADAGEGVAGGRA